jgi:predicted RNase H-like HicB family nuclease/DNA-binding XRE family transcriptional regulator
MEKLIYPAIFHKNEGSKHGYWVEFPDLPGCLTEGDTLEEAFLMAGDALDCWFADPDQEHPNPTPITEIKAEKGDIIQMVQPAPYTSENAKQYIIKEAIEKGLEERKLSQNQAATILAVDRSYITHILNGKKTPSPDMAKRMGLLFDFDWRIFYTDSL